MPYPTLPIDFECAAYDCFVREVSLECSGVAVSRSYARAGVSSTKGARCVIVAALASGCSLTLGPTGTSVLTQPRSQHVGATVSTQLRLPREYNTIIGIEESLLGQVSPESRADQWRVAAFGGYSEAPTAGGTALGWEGALRAGFYRGSSAAIVPAGALVGAKLDAPIIRLTPRQDPWQRDNLLDTEVWMLVPEFGLNTLWSRTQDFQLEATVTLALRCYISTTLLP